MNTSQSFKVHPKAILLFIFSTLTLFGLCLPISRQYTDVFSRFFFFGLTADEGLHLELIEHFFQTGIYSQWKSPLFSLILTTGPTVILPASLLSVLGIPPIWAARGVVLAYHLASVVLIYRLIFKSDRNSQLKHRIAALLGTFVFLNGLRSIDGPFYYAYGVMGEGPGLFFILASLLAFRSNRGFLAGILAALSCLSKPFYLLFAFSLTLASLFQKTSRKTFWKIIAGGLCTAFFVFILMTLHAGSVSSVVNQLLSYPELMRQVNGAGLPKKSIFENLIFNLRNFPVDYFGIALGLLGLFYGLKNRNQKIIPVALVFLTIHLLWFLVLSPGAQTRYLYPAAAISWLVGAIATARWVFQLPILQKPPLIAGAILGLTLSLFKTAIESSLNISKVWNSPACQTCVQNETQKKWQEIASHFQHEVLISTQDYGENIEELCSEKAEVQNITIDQLSSLPSSKSNLILIGLTTEKEFASEVRKTMKPFWSNPVDPQYGFWITP